MPVRNLFHTKYFNQNLSEQKKANYGMSLIFPCTYPGVLPLVITLEVSPAGRHSVHIVASSGPEATVSYFVDSLSTSAGQPQYSAMQHAAG